MRHTSRQRGSLAAGGGLIGLLIVVAIILYLMVGSPGGGGGGAGAGAAPGGGGGASYLGNVKNTRDAGFRTKIGTMAYALEQMIATHVLSEDKYPKSLDDLGPAAATTFRDPWGTDITFTIDETKQPRELTVTSAGPDQTFGTPDDITVTRQMSL